MLTLTNGELAQMRTELETTLPGTAVLHTRTTVSDGQGGYTQTYAASATVDARLSPEALRRGEGELAGRLAETQPMILTIPAETSVPATARVVYASVTYEVSEMLPRVPWELSRRVRLVRVD